MSSSSFDNYIAEHLSENFTTDDLQSFGFRSASDFYAEPNNVERGLTLPFGDAQHFGQMHEGWSSDKSDRMGVSPSSMSRFESSDLPPALQEEEKCYLELTSLYLEECSPIMIANQLLDLFQTILVARVKRNRKKFTIKAEVVHEGLACTVKARIYSKYQDQRERSTVLDFQRRSGDTVAFHKVYRKVVGHLQGHPCDYPAWDTAVLDDFPHEAKEALAPLLDILVSSKCARLLAEVALSLSEMATDPMVAAQLRKPCYLSALQHLRQIDDFSIAYATSHILACF